LIEINLQSLHSCYYSHSNKKVCIHCLKDTNTT